MKPGLTIAFLALAGATSIDNVNPDSIGAAHCRLIQQHMQASLENCIDNAITKAEAKEESCTLRIPKGIKPKLEGLEEDLKVLSLVYTKSNRKGYKVLITPQKIDIEVPPRPALKKQTQKELV
jgi:hypothetical protein